MTTTVKPLGAAKVVYTGQLFDPALIKVERAGPPGPSALKPYGKPRITTIEQVAAETDPDDSGDPTWGRSLRPGEKFISSNDCQRCVITFRVKGTKAKPRTVYMTFFDLADVDTTGADLWFNGTHAKVAYQPNGRVNTFEITTTEDTLDVTVDVGTMPTKARPGGVADGWAARFPCLKVIG